MDTSTTIKKIQLNGENYFLKVVWADDFKFTLFNRDQFWTGILTLDKIEYFCTQLNLNKEQYNENAFKAFSANDSTNDFTIKFSNNKLVWEKDIRSSTLSMKHGFVEMEYSPEGGSEILISELLGTIKEKNNLLESKDQELQNVAKELNLLMGKFQDCSDLKIKMEEDLYGRFIVLINEKKKKIAEYEDFIKHLQSKGSIFI